VEIVDLYLLFQISQKDARIRIRGKKKFSRSTMEMYFDLYNLGEPLGKESPFIG
jgi:hypothetical protein